MNPPDWLTDPMFRNVYETICRKQAPDIAYDAWLDHWFGRPVLTQNFPWFEDVPDTIFRPAMAFSYGYRLFNNSARDLERFSDDQVGAGMWLLMTDDDINLAWPDIPIAEREACILAITSLFRDLFAQRCAPRLSDGPREYTLLNGSCYMWWEYFTHIAFPGDPNFQRLMGACWRVMEETLYIPHVAVQESALHGLGHSTHNDRQRVETIIDRWRSKHSDSDAELLAYAGWARGGCIQ